MDVPEDNLGPLDCLTFDLTGYVVRAETDLSRTWMNDHGVATLLRFGPPPLWSFDLTQLDRARDFYGNQCKENHGVMLELEVEDVNDLELLWGVFKYRSPVKDSLGMMYVGIIWIPFQNCNFQINVESLESGTTGTREAAVMLMDGDAGWPKSDAPPIKVSGVKDLFARMKKSRATSPVPELPSDQRKYDEKFPDHPLSKVRARLSGILATLDLNERSPVIRPFRIANATK